MKPAIVLTILMVLTSSAHTLAGPRQAQRDKAINESVASPSDCGLGFIDPIIAECIQLLAAEKRDQAIARMKAAVDEMPASFERKLGLSMLYIRTNQVPKSGPILTKLAKSSDDPPCMSRAKVLSMIANKAKGKSKAQALASDAGWAAALNEVIQDCSQTVQKEHVALQSAIKARQWNRFAAHLSVMRDKFALAEVITLSDAPAQVGGKHLDGLRREIADMNSTISAMIQHARDLRFAVRTGGGLYKGGRHRTHERTAEPEGRALYNNFCAEIRTAVDAGRALEEEYRNTLDKSGLTRGYPRNLAIKHARLPEPIP